MSASTLRQSSKRRKPEEEPETTVKKHLSLWFDDGNVILVAKDGATSVRLHRSVLSLHSEIFKDILSLPSRDEDNEMIEGCPVVHLQESPGELVLFFDLFYSGEAQRKFLDMQTQTPFYELRSIVILSYKYEVKHIQTTAVAKIELDFPPDFDRFDSKYCVDKATPSRNKSSDCVTLVNTARKLNLTHLLPIALYTCTVILENLLDPIRYPSGGEEQLSSEDARLCLRAVAKLDELLSRRTSIFLNFESDDVCNKPPGICTQAVYSLLQYLHNHRHGFLTKKWLLWPIDNHIDEALLFITQGGQPCGPCLKRLRSKLNDLRRETWNWFPFIFDLQ